MEERAVPSLLINMTRAKLKSIRKALQSEGGLALRELCSQHRTSNERRLLDRIPTGTNVDYWHQGLSKGAIDSMKFIEDLVELIDYEIEKRQDEPAEED